MTKFVIRWTEKSHFESEPIEAQDQDEALDMFMHDDCIGRDRVQPYETVTDEIGVEEVNDDS